jgi:hypothetical protein
VKRPDVKRLVFRMAPLATARVCHWLSVETKMENEDASFPFALFLHAVRHDEQRQPMDGGG